MSADRTIGFNGLLKKVFNRETTMYAIVGFATTALNVGLFALLVATGLDYRVANLVTLVVTKLAAYAMNKIIVFRTVSETFSHLAREFFLFTLTRGGTMLIDYFGLILLVSLFDANKTVGKLIVTVVVIAVNYVLGKLIVFRKREE